MKEYSAEDIEPLSFAECVCNRPRMWTTNGSLEEVIALFNGYEIAMAHTGGHGKERPSPSDALGWLYDSIDNQGGLPTLSEFVAKLRQRFLNDQTVFATLSVWLKEKRLESQ